MQNKTIAIFQGYFLPHVGGVERYTYNLAKKLNDKGYKIFIITTKYEDGLLEKEDIGFAIVYRLPIHKLFSNRYPIIKNNKNYRRIIKELRTLNIDSIILNTRFWLSTLVGAKFAKKNNIPCCVIEHGTSHFTVYNKFLDFAGLIYEHLLTLRVKSLVKDFYGVSKACTEWLKHYKINAKGVFYNAIDAEEYNTYKDAHYMEESNKIRILFAGRLIKDKGILLLVEAYNELCKKYNNIELIIAGDGQLKQEIEGNENIIFTGSLTHNEIMKLYNDIDIFVNPSYSEGMPTSIIEAGLMKCAVIATPVGGTVELIENEKSGLFCKTTSESVKEKIEILINNKELRQTLQENIHSRIKEKFTWENTAEEVVRELKL